MLIYVELIRQQNLHNPVSPKDKKYIKEMDSIKIDVVCSLYFNRHVWLHVLNTQPVKANRKQGVALLFMSESTSNPMQVPTSQQKEGIYDVPKRHFMTVGVFIFYHLFSLFFYLQTSL